MIINIFYIIFKFVFRKSQLHSIAYLATRNAIIQDISSFIVHSVYSVVYIFRPIFVSSSLKFMWSATTIMTVFFRYIFNVLLCQKEFQPPSLGCISRSSKKFIKRGIIGFKVILSILISYIASAFSAPNNFSSSKSGGIYGSHVSALALTFPPTSFLLMFFSSNRCSCELNYYKFSKLLSHQIYDFHGFALKRISPKIPVLLSRQYLLKSLEIIREYITDRFYCLDANIIPSFAEI